MFKNTSKESKWVISILLCLSILQSWMYHNKPATMEVEAKVCTVEDVACTRSDELAELVGADRPVYMCIQGP